MGDNASVLLSESCGLVLEERDNFSKCSPES